MVHDIIEICRSYPQIVVFLAIAIGYFVGKMKFRGFNIGSTAGVLIVALVLGQMTYQGTAAVKGGQFCLIYLLHGLQGRPTVFWRA